MKKSIQFVTCLLLLCVIPFTAFAAEVPLQNSVPFELSKNGTYYMAELHTDTVLYAKDADRKMYPASLTKIMTAILTLENCPDLSQTCLLLHI